MILMIKNNNSTIKFTANIMINFIVVDILHILIDTTIPIKKIIKQDV